ncbi:MAG: heme lyase CcmF/NrfE family subunit [Chloroflexi bacterium]|nr:heme lyase CcmF/NrfE family subunit [Chloroflexota bacterium]
MGTLQIAGLGNLTVWLGFALALYTVGAALVAVQKRRPAMMASAENGIYAVAALTTLAVAIMEWAAITHQFRFEYIASHVSLDQPLLYTISSLWGGQEGSLLFWVWLLSLFAAIVTFQNRDQNRELMPYAIAFMAFTQGFFFLLLIVVAQPFKMLNFTPQDGQGLNPLLQNPGMFIHPITQYLGYVGFTVPFAFAMAALTTGRLSDAWIRTTRRWTLISWLFLSLGLLFGMRWAYVELGWGGYWGWDPVENASLIPWLTGTAYLHSVMIQEKRGMLKVWNLVLVMLTYILSILGTFLTRSGVVQSVHAFGTNSLLASIFLGYMAGVILLFLYLLYTRLGALREENEIDSVVSREATFLLNNLLLVGAAFATLWGTIFPMISELATGKQITVAAPFFNTVNGPIFFLLIVLMGVCTMIGWRRASVDNLVRNFLRPLLVSAVVVGGLFALGVREPLGLTAFGAAGFVSGTIMVEFFRAAGARMRQHGENPPTALAMLFVKNRRRYGGYVVHIGIVMAVVGIAGSTFFQADLQKNVRTGETIAIKQYTLRFDGLASYAEENHQVWAANLTVFENGAQIATLKPEKNYYPASEQSTTEIAVRSTAMEDLYLILAGSNDDGSVTIKAIVNPLISWLWIGFGVFMLGTLIAAWPDPREARVMQRIQMREAAVAAGR